MHGAGTGLLAGLRCATAKTADWGEAAPYIRHGFGWNEFGEACPRWRLGRCNQDVPLAGCER
jgi:hypothetical protein